MVPPQSDSWLAAGHGTGSYSIDFCRCRGLHRKKRRNASQARLSLLKPLIKYNTPFSTEISTDSITVWEKLLEPELEEQQHYSLLFQLKLLTVRALITEGHFSLAIDKANSMYQKAKEMSYSLGTALSLQAIGNTYLNSSTPLAAIESYKEALEIISKDLMQTNMPRRF